MAPLTQLTITQNKGLAVSSKVRDRVRVANRHGLLSKSVAISALMSMTTGVMAETKTKTAAESAEGNLEEVVISGIRGSLQESLETKRDAASIVDAINAEDLGKFPDKNVADSLARITGVSITRGFGEGEKIAVRGTSPNQNRTLLNGHAVASADWFVLDTPSRAFNYTLLPSTIVSSLEVYKAPQAQIQEGSIGGTTYVRTRKPLDMDANSGSVSIQSQYSTESEEVDPQFSGMYSWKNDDETFGILGSYTYQERNLVRNGKEVYGFSQQEVDGQNLWVPRAMGDAYFQQKRERETILVSMQVRPTDRAEFTVNYLNSNLQANNTNVSNYTWFLDNWRTDGVGVQDGANVAGSGVNAGTATNAHSEYYVIDRASDSSTESINMELNYAFDRLNLTTNIGRTTAEGGTSSDQHYNYYNYADAVRFDQNLNVVREYEGIEETEEMLLDRPLKWMQEGGRTMTDVENYAMVDLDIPVDLGSFVNFKTGLLYRDHSKSQKGNSVRFHYGGYNGEDNQPSWLSQAEEAVGSLGDHVKSAKNAPFPVLDVDVVKDIVYPDKAYRYPTANVLTLGDTWSVNEKIYATYFSGDFEMDRFSGNIGVRVVYTDMKSTGYQYNGDDIFAALWLDGGYEYLIGTLPSMYAYQDTFDKNYTSILPNLNLSYELSDDLILRGSLARTMARPDYKTLSNTRFQDTSFNGYIGNPDLDPEYANQIDTSLEWYFAEQSLLSAALFFKDIKDTVVNDITTITLQDENTGNMEDIDFIQPVNGKGSTVAGLELSYQQAFGDFGVIANYTYTSADSKDKRDALNNPGSGLVAGSSDHMANLTGFYENDWFSARLMYNFRTEYYAGLSEFGSEEYADDYGQVDMSATVYVPGVDGLSVTLEGVNILEESLEAYHIDKDRKSYEYDNGARWLLGLNYTF